MQSEPDKDSTTRVGENPYKAAVMRVLTAALEAVDPYRATLHALQTRDLTLPPGGKIYVLGAGKAGAAMSRAAEEVLGERIAGGLVIVKDGHRGDVPLQQIELVEAGHPVPDERGVAATERLLKIAGQAGPDDWVVCLISGGGSALLTAPAPGLSLEDVQATTAALLHSGATINELNAVRKHLSRVAGGQLAMRAASARVLSLVLSDVTGSPLDVIASGPTAPDPTTYYEATGTIEKYGLRDKIPSRVTEALEAGSWGKRPETPKPGERIFGRVENIVIASNVIAVEAARRKVVELGLNTAIMSTFIEGEAREVGIVLAGIAREIAAFGRPVEKPACMLWGGETTVTMRGDGVGGRNSELALSAALKIDGLGSNVLIASLATDGGDGASPGAGAIIDGTTVAKGKALGLDAQAALAGNDSYTYLAQTGDALVLGPTGTNVNDIMAIFVF